LVLGATPAQAGQQTTKDVAHDVFKVVLPSGNSRVVPKDKVHDVIRAGAVHRGARLTLWLEVRRLAGGDSIAHFDVKTSGDRWQLYYDTRVSPAYTSLFHGLVEVLDCDGLRGRKLPRKDRVEVSVPRSCIGNPSWVRFGATMGRETNTVVLIDDARLDAGFYANGCKLGPRLRHN
jgi:hypothetical protein